MLIFYIFCSLLWICVNSKVFDQRQTGDLNVQVDLKDLRIFAMLSGKKEEYVDYDYAYDYSELTIKPQNRTTPKPFLRPSTSVQQTNMQTNSTITPIPLQSNYTESITVADSINVTDIGSSTIKQLTERTTEAFVDFNTTVTPIPSPPTKNCKRGFVLNQNGDCLLKQNSTGNALMKLVKLSQKLKQRRGNKNP